LPTHLPEAPLWPEIGLLYTAFWQQVRPANENLTARGIEWRERQRQKWREAKRRWRAKKRLAEQAEAEWELPQRQWSTRTRKLVPISSSTRDQHNLLGHT
jgi:hypothetical protein